MPWVWVSIGSNIQRTRHVRAALTALEAQFGTLTVSPVYETPAEGFEGDPFFNLVAGFATELGPAELHQSLRAIETANGRVRGAAKFSARTLDIDALTYGNQVGNAGGKALPRDEILHYAFVLKPLVDVAANEKHPALGASYAALWDAFDGDKSGLSRVKGVWP